MQRRDFFRVATAAGAALTSSASADQPTAPRIKIGQIGTSHAHANKLAVYRRNPDYEVVGVVEPNEALRKRAEATAAFKDVNWFTREQLLNHAGLQAVLVETPVRDLLSNAEECIKAGKHIHIDKPAGASLPHLRRILDLATKQKLFVQMGYMYRYNPGVLMLREFLSKGLLGQVFEVQTVMSKVVDKSDRAELAKFQGGILFEIGCHVIDLVVGVLGAPKSVAGYAQHVSKLADGLADNTLAVFEYPQAIASIKSSAMEVEGFSRRQLTVCGTEGTFHIQPLDNPAVRVALSSGRGDLKKGYQDIALPKYERYVADAADMARVIRGVKQADFTPEHDLAVQVSLLRACRMSLE